MRHGRWVLIAMTGTSCFLEKEGYDLKGFSFRKLSHAKPSSNHPYRYQQLLILLCLTLRISNMNSVVTSSSIILLLTASR